MKSAGVVRKIDDLGRVSIPKELRQMYQWQHNDEVEFFIDGDSIVLKRVSSVEDKFTKFASIICDACWAASTAHCVVCTLDRIVATSKGSGYEVGKLVSPFFKGYLMKHREPTMRLTNKNMPKILSDYDPVECIVPIFHNDEVIGAVVLPKYYENTTAIEYTVIAAVAATFQKLIEM